MKSTTRTLLTCGDGFPYARLESRRPVDSALVARVLLIAETIHNALPELPGAGGPFLDAAGSFRMTRGVYEDQGTGMLIVFDRAVEQDPPYALDNPVVVEGAIVFQIDYGVIDSTELPEGVSKPLIPLTRVLLVEREYEVDGEMIDMLPLIEHHFEVEECFADTHYESYQSED